MQVRAQQGLAVVQQFAASTVVIEDAAGTPIAVAIETSPGVILASTAGQPDFQQLLTLAGVRQTVYVTKAAQQPLDSVRF